MILTDFHAYSSCHHRERAPEIPLNSHTAEQKDNDSGSAVHTSQNLLQDETEMMLKA